jgi:hypothetical protein
MTLLALVLLASPAHAAACVCARNVALPSAGVLRPWAGVFTADYGARLDADPTGWQGFHVVDKYGDSMAGMYMPPMLVHTASVSATLGLPEHLSVSTTVPYMYKDNLGESEMRGDTDLSSLNDVDVTAHWAYRSPDERAFVALSAGPTFPTGTVVPNSPVRSGRGVLGVTAATGAGVKVSRKVLIAAQVSGATGFGADSSGYTVAPTASLVAGAQWTPRENGRLSLALLGIERWSGMDQQDALVYQNSGYLASDIAAVASWTFWEETLRSAGVTLRAQAPVFQIVGDPMYAHNFGASLGITFVAF